MGSKLYVGNLSYSITNADLEQMFTPHGAVSSAEIINDRDTGRSKGFGFVQMGTDEEAQAAISALNGQENDGRALTVNEAKPREDRPRSGGGGNGGGSSRGSYGGNSSSANTSNSTGYVAREKGNGGKGRDSDSRRY
jgi:RNA recognition motif-containing protein